MKHISIQPKAQNQEKPSEDSSPKKEEQKEDDSHQIILNEILKMYLLCLVGTPFCFIVNLS